MDKWKYRAINKEEPGFRFTKLANGQPSSAIIEKAIATVVKLFNLLDECDVEILQDSSYGTVALLLDLEDGMPWYIEFDNRYKVYVTNEDGVAGILVHVGGS